MRDLRSIVPRAPFERGLLGIAVVALVVRVAATLVLTGEYPSVGSSVFFHEVANLVADGEGFVQPFALAFAGVPVPTAEHPPLWPLLLSFASLFGADSVMAHRLVGAVLGAAVVVVVGLLGRAVAGPRTGLLAAAIAAVYPVLVAADGSLMSDTLYGLLVGLALLATLRALQEPSTGRLVAVGVACGLAALTRGEGVLLLVLLAGVIAWRARAAGRSWPRPLAAVLLAGALTIAPWTVRNLSSFERPVLVSTNDGAVLAAANCPATYRGVDIGARSLGCVPQRRPGLDESEQRGVWRRAGLDYAFDHPDRWVPVVATRVLRTWDLYQPGRQVRFAEGRHTGLGRAGLLAYYALLALAAYGLASLRTRGGLPLVLLAPVAIVLTVSVLGYGAPQVRHAAELPLVVLGAVGAVALAARVRTYGVVSVAPGPLSELGR